MKLFKVIIIFSLLSFGGLKLVSNTSTQRHLASPTSCYECLNDSAYKYCSIYGANKCWAITDNSGTWNSSRSIVSWSNESTFSGNLKYTLWPINSNWGQQSSTFEANSGSVDISINYSNVDYPLCYYKFTKGDDSFEYIQLIANSSNTATVEIYLESDSGTLTTIQNFEEKKMLNQTLEEGETILVIALFEQFPASLEINASKSVSAEAPEQTPTESSKLGKSTNKIKIIPSDQKYGISTEVNERFRH